MADVEQQTVEPQAPAAPLAPAAAAALAAAPAADPEDPARKRRVNNATIFLKNPKVQASPLVRRINFLKSKGVKEDEIVDAFNAAGQKMTMADLKKAMESTPVVTAAPAAQPQAAPQQAPGGMAQGLQSQLQPQHVPPQQHMQQPGMYQQQPQYYQQPQYQQPGQMMPPPPPPPHMQAGPPVPPPPPPQQPPKSVAATLKDNWKDMFIGAVALAGITFGVGKAVSAYSPYAFVRKDEQSARQQQLEQLQQQAAAPQLPPVPEGPSEKEKDLEKQLKVAQSEVEHKAQRIADLEKDLEKERAAKAQLQMDKGKQLGQISILSRDSEKAKRLAEELNTAKTKITELEKELSTASSPSASGAPPLELEGDDKEKRQPSPGATSSGPEAIDTAPTKSGSGAAAPGLLPDGLVESRMNTTAADAASPTAAAVAGDLSGSPGLTREDTATLPQHE